MRTRILIILAAVLLAGASLLTLAQSPAAADRLNLARQTETKGGLDKALEIYESVLKDFPNDKVAGAAIERIVKLYDLMGKADAMREACGRLMSGYENRLEVTDDARALCGKKRSRPGIFIAKMDAQSGVVQPQVRTVTDDPNTQETYPRLSPDGKLVAFKRTLGTGDQAAIIVRSLADKTEHTMRACGNAISTGRTFWLPDGRSVLFFATVGAGSCVGVYDSQSGDLLRSFNVGGNLPSLWSVLSPDGQLLHTLIPTSFLSANTATLVALDLGTRTLTRAFTLPFAQASVTTPATIPLLALSPDGRTAVSFRTATTSNARLVSFDTDGEARHYRELFVAGTQLKGVAWSRDGKRIFFGVSADGAKWRIMQILADGGPVSFTGLEVDGLQYFEPNGDNTEIAFDGLLPTVSAPGPYTPPAPPAALPAPPSPPPATPPAGGGRGGRG